VPIANLSVTSNYLPPLPVGGPYLSGYGALQNQFPLVYDVLFQLNYYGTNTALATSYSLCHSAVLFLCNPSALKTRIACLRLTTLKCVDVCQRNASVLSTGCVIYE